MKTPEELVNEYFKELFPDATFTFMQRLKDTHLEVDGMYMADVVVNNQWSMPCMLYITEFGRLFVFMDYKRSREVNRLLEVEEYANRHKTK